jgi:hypothetical protein
MLLCDTNQPEPIKSCQAKWHQLDAGWCLNSARSATHCSFMFHVNACALMLPLCTNHYLLILSCATLPSALLSGQTSAFRACDGNMHDTEAAATTTSTRTAAACRIERHQHYTTALYSRQQHMPQANMQLQHQKAPALHSSTLLN